ncbi:MAG: efflux RND transporter periplasmic adaptor subunit [Fusobacteria bacterium]|nr:efflux RND transporter periplasmic adaptor subunit [Fusobacteriota bacterium]
MKKIGYVTGATLIALSVLGGCGKKTEPAKDVSIVKLTTVGMSGSLQQYTYNGIVQATTQSNVSFKVDGNITNMYVSQGDFVKSGTILATLDPSNYELQLQSAQANLQQAKAQAQNAKSDLIRAQQLYAQGDASAASLDNATAQYQYAQNEVISVQKKIGVLQNQLSYTQLAAPFTGTISVQLVDQGTNVAAGTPVFVMTSANTTYQVFVGVPIDTVQNVKVGQSVQIQNGSENFNGVIQSISNVPTGVGNTYQIRVNLVKPPKDVVIGMTLNVTFNIPNKYMSNISGSGFLVPNTSVTKINNQTGVFGVNSISGSSNLKLQFIPVDIQKAMPSGYIVKGALRQGQQIVAAGTYSINDGQIVTPLVKED